MPYLNTESLSIKFHTIKSMDVPLLAVSLSTRPTSVPPTLSETSSDQMMWGACVLFNYSEDYEF